MISTTSPDPSRTPEHTAQVAAIAQLQGSNLQDAKSAAKLGVIGSGLLAILKISAGVAGHSHAVLADGIESVGDTLASSVVLFGLKISVLPPDREHPYGHGRAEGIAGKTIATMMLASGLLLLWTNTSELLSVVNTGVPANLPALWTLWPAVISIFAKTGMFMYKLRVSRRVGSMALKADAFNDFMDILSAVMVVVGVLTARQGYAWADHSAALAVSVLIVLTSARVFRETTRALLDEQAPPDVLADIRALATSVPGVVGVEKILARRAGLLYFVDMHLEVNGDMPVREAHQIGHRVKALVQSRRGDIADVLIHIEPAE